MVAEAITYWSTVLLTPVVTAAVVLFSIFGAGVATIEMGGLLIYGAGALRRRWRQWRSAKVPIDLEVQLAGRITIHGTNRLGGYSSHTVIVDAGDRLSIMIHPDGTVVPIVSKP